MVVGSLCLWPPAIDRNTNLLWQEPAEVLAQSRFWPGHEDRTRARFYTQQMLTTTLARKFQALVGFLFLFCALTLFSPAHAFTIVIDPGHGGNDLGARYGGLLEKNLVRDVSLALRTELEKEKGLKVLLTRDTDSPLALSDRVRFADASEPDLFLSIHANASENKNVKGAEFYLRSMDFDHSAAKTPPADSDLEVILAELHQQGQFLNSLALSKDLVKNWPVAVSSRSLRQAPFYVLNKTKAAPAILIEIGYMSHTGERKRLREPSVQNSIVMGIKKTLLGYRDRYLSSQKEQKAAPKE